MNQAMIQLVQTILQNVASNGLPGKHHFFITFDTFHSGVNISDRLRERYPSQMTIVIQHWYQDLEVKNSGFSITLSFDQQPEFLFVPYSSIKMFVDPSVNFGLQFDFDINKLKNKTKPQTVEKQIKSDKPSHNEAEIVSLDKFRK